MPSRRELRAHLARVQLAVSCVSRAVVLTNGRQLWLAGQPVRLGGEYPSSLVVSRTWASTPARCGWSTTTTGWSGTTRYNHEHVVYHRHGGRHGFDHLYVSYGPMHGLALPTGQVELEQVVAYASRAGRLASAGRPAECPQRPLTAGV